MGIYIVRPDGFGRFCVDYSCLSVGVIALISRIRLYLWRRRYRRWAGNRPIKEKIRECSGVTDYMRDIAQANPEEALARRQQLMTMLQAQHGAPTSLRYQYPPSASEMFYSSLGGLFGNLLGKRFTK